MVQTRLQAQQARLSGIRNVLATRMSNPTTARNWAGQLVLLRGAGANLTNFHARRQLWRTQVDQGRQALQAAINASDLNLTQAKSSQNRDTLINAYTNWLSLRIEAIRAHLQNAVHFNNVIVGLRIATPPTGDNYRPDWWPNLSSSVAPELPPELVLQKLEHVRDRLQHAVSFGISLPFDDHGFPIFVYEETGRTMYHLFRFGTL